LSLYKNGQVKQNIFKRVFLFYYNGFRNMPEYGVKLWLIILLKLFVIFIILKFLFFNDTLKTKFDNDKDRSEFVLDKLTDIK